MKILFCYYIPSGGVDTLNRQRWKALTQIGIETHFLYLHKGSGLQNKIAAPVHVTNSDIEISSLITREKYDAIIVCSDHELLERIRSYGYKGPVIYEIQGLGKNKNFAKKYLSFTAKDYIDHYSDALLYPKTKHLAEVVEQIFPNKKRFSFHNCIDLDTFRYRKVAPPPSFPIIGWVGRLEKNKNWRDFLTISAQLLPSYPQLKLWMFIDDSLSKPTEKRRFENAVAKLGLGHSIHIHNNIPHHIMPDYYSKIGDSGGFLLSTSLIEGFGYAVLEAMCCRCPVLTSNSDGVTSFVIHNETGKLFQYGRTGLAVQEALELMGNPQLREHIRSQGINYVTSRFALSQYASNFNSMLQNL